MGAGQYGLAATSAVRQLPADSPNCTTTAIPVVIHFEVPWPSWPCPFTGGMPVAPQNESLPKLDPRCIQPESGVCCGPGRRSIIEIQVTKRSPQDLHPGLRSCAPDGARLGPPFPLTPALHNQAYNAA